jgi:hypothetical protein
LLDLNISAFDPKRTFAHRSLCDAVKPVSGGYAQSCPTSYPEDVIERIRIRRGCAPSGKVQACVARADIASFLPSSRRCWQSASLAQLSRRSTLPMRSHRPRPASKLMIAHPERNSHVSSAPTPATTNHRAPACGSIRIAVLNALRPLECACATSRIRCTVLLCPTASTLAISADQRRLLGRRGNDCTRGVCCIRRL